MENNPKKLYKPISEFEWKDASEEEIKQDSLPHYADKFETMEKINTPLWQLIKEIDTLRDGVVDLEQIDIFDAYTGLRQMVVKLLPTEREVIEEAFIAGDLRDRSELPDRYDDEPAKDYFNQTFKSYE